MTKVNPYAWCLVPVVLLVLAAPAVALDAPTPICPVSTSSGTAYTTTTPTFCWSPVDGAEGYEIRIMLLSGVADPIIIEVPAGNCWTPGKNRGLSPGETYNWNVYALSGQGKGPISGSASFQVGNVKNHHIPAPAFAGYTPTDTATFWNGGAWLEPDQDRRNEFIAPVNLPHGAQVTSLRFVYGNDGGVNEPSECHLHRGTLGSIGRENMASITGLTTTDTQGATTAITQNIDNAFIDNDSYKYFVRAILPSQNNHLFFITINYAQAP